MANFFENLLPIFKTVITEAANVGEITAPIIDLFNPALGVAIKSISDIVLGSQAGTASDTELTEIINLIATGWTNATGKTPDPVAVAAVIASGKAFAPQIAQHFLGASDFQAKLIAAFPKVTP